MDGRSAGAGQVTHQLLECFLSRPACLLLGDAPTSCSQTTCPAPHLAAPPGQTGWLGLLACGGGGEQHMLPLRFKPSPNGSSSSGTHRHLSTWGTCRGTRQSACSGCRSPCWQSQSGLHLYGWAGIPLFTGIPRSPSGHAILFGRDAGLRPLHSEVLAGPCSAGCRRGSAGWRGASLPTHSTAAHLMFHTAGAQR